jgi:hypothetical protein
MTVELGRHASQVFGAQPFKITATLRCSDGPTEPRGCAYTRGKNLCGTLGRQLNEDAAPAGVIGNVLPDRSRPTTVDTDPGLVPRERVLRTTNRSYPDRGVDPDLLKNRDKKWIATSAECNRGRLFQQVCLVQCIESLFRLQSNHPILPAVSTLANLCVRPRPPPLTTQHEQQPSGQTLQVSLYRQCASNPALASSRRQPI